MTETENVIELTDLTKKFGKEKIVVDRLNLSVSRGEIFGFAGPNGAGKTTTMKMMLGLLEPSEGSGRILGHDIVRDVIHIREKTGFMPEPAGFYDHLTARQNLRFYSKFYRMSDDVREKKIEDLLHLVGLENAADQKIGGFSTGMRKRFCFAQALINDPEILFLDEPTSGVDPKGSQMMRDLIRKISREKNVTVFLSSHSMEEIESICDRIGIMNKGKLAAVGTIDDLRKKAAEKEGFCRILNVSGIPPEITAGLLREIPGFISAEVRNGSVILFTKNDNREAISATVTNAGGMILGFEEKRMSLQDIFMKLTEND